MGVILAIAQKLPMGNPATTPPANTATPTPRIVRFGLFELDLRTHELRKKGLKIKLQEQPCHILAILLEHPGEVITRDELRNALWPSDTFVDFNHSLNSAIMRLREVLGDSSENPRFIETLSRRGYRFIAPVDDTISVETEQHPVVSFPPLSERPEVSPRPSISSVPFTTAGGPEPTRVGSRRTAYRVGILIATVALVCGLALYLVRRSSGTKSKPDGLKSLVVLPLENLSGDKDQDYFADGMTDELIASLAKIRSLRVISRTSAMEYKGTHKPLSEIARDLNVDAVVEGTVLRSGDQVRITAELVQVSTDRHLWAETYEGPLGDVLTLQSRVASAIVSEIRVKLTPEEQQRLSANRTINSDAYEDYLKGRYYWNKRSQEDLTKAIEYFQSATKKDPQYALAYAGLADCYSIIGSAIVGTVPSQEVAPLAKAAALKAVELDGSLAEAQTSLATVRFNYDWDWEGAARGFQRAIELNPSYATAYQRYSLYLIAMGRSRESLSEIKRARDLDPLSISTNFSLGWRLYMARQYGQAIEQLRNTIDMDPNFPLPHLVLGQAYEQSGLSQKAIEEFQKGASLSHNSAPMLSALAHAYAITGERVEAQRVLDHLIEESKQQYISPFYVAIVYGGLGEHEKAIDWLDKAYQDRSNGMVFLKVDPQLDPLRSNPRFQALLRRLNLPE